MLTTHYLDEAEALADRVGVIAGGRLVEVAAPNRLGDRQEALATVSWRTPGRDAGARADRDADGAGAPSWPRASAARSRASP